MLHLSSHERYYFYNQVVDMRKGCYGLCGIVHNELKKHILSGDVFVFINKRHNQIKLLQWDRDGFALYENSCANVGSMAASTLSQGRRAASSASG